MSARAPKIMISIAAAFTAVVPAAADVNASHLFNPLWPPHARFHGAVFVVVNILAGLISLGLLWGRYRERDTRFAVSMAALLPALCWAPFAPVAFLPGTSIWPDGLGAPPAPINANVIISVVITALCVAAVVVDRRARRAAEPPGGAVPG